MHNDFLAKRQPVPKIGRCLEIIQLGDNLFLAFFTFRFMKVSCRALRFGEAGLRLGVPRSDLRTGGSAAGSRSGGADARRAEAVAAGGRSAPAFRAGDARPPSPGPGSLWLQHIQLASSCRQRFEPRDPAAGPGEAAVFFLGPREDDARRRCGKRHEIMCRAANLAFRRRQAHELAVIAAKPRVGTGHLRPAAFVQSRSMFTYVANVPDHLTLMALLLIVIQ